MAVSAVRQRDGAQECGVFVLDVVRETAEHVVDNPGGECFDSVSVWKGLSLSPDGSRAVGTAGSKNLGVIDLKQHRIEKLWPGSAAAWSPDGKWIAALTYALPAEIQLIRASDLSTARTLGQTSVGRLQWSPDSRYLLLLDMGACGIATGYSEPWRRWILTQARGQRSPAQDARLTTSLSAGSATTYRGDTYHVANNVMSFTESENGGSWAKRSALSGVVAALFPISSRQVGLRKTARPNPPSKSRKCFPLGQSHRTNPTGVAR